MQPAVQACAYKVQKWQGMLLNLFSVKHSLEIYLTCHIIRLVSLNFITLEYLL